MTILYVTSEHEGEGKTAICAALTHLLREMGEKATAFKPFADEGASDEDSIAYEKLLGVAGDGWPLELPAGDVSDEQVGMVKSLAQRLSEGADVVIIEGASGIAAAGHKRIAEELDARAIVVSAYRQNLSPAALKPWEAVFGKRLAGFVINGLTRYMEHDARTRMLPELESAGLDILGIAPEDRRLLCVTVSQLAKHLEGRFVGFEEALNEGKEKLVEHLMVAGMMLDNSEFFFQIHENKAAIARGDRPDLFMGALRSNTACLVAARGIEPIEYVLNEAEQEGVPVIVVDTDTLDTMAALNNLIDRARFDHPLKVERMASMLRENLNLARIFSTLGVGT